MWALSDTKKIALTEYFTIQQGRGSDLVSWGPIFGTPGPGLKRFVPGTLSPRSDSPYRPFQKGQWIQYEVRVG